MKQMARGALALVALVGLTACVDDPQEQINNDDFKTLQAYPEVAWVRAGTDSTAVYFRLLNDFGYGTPTHLTVSDVQGPIEVHHDLNYRRYFTAGDVDSLVPYVDGHLQRFFVLQPTPGEASFKVTASNGVSTTVRVRIEAANLGALPTKTAVVGQSITLNAPAFQKFAPDAQVTYLRGARPSGFPDDTSVSRTGTAASAGVVTNRAADGSSLTFRASSDILGRITVTKTLPLHTGLDPNFTPVALSTTDSLTVPGFGTRRVNDFTTGRTTDTIVPAGSAITVGGVDATGTTVQPGQVMTIKLGGLPGSTGSAAGTVPLTFLANSRVFIGTAEAGVVHTAVDPAVAAIGVDSNTVQVLLPAHVAAVGGSLPITIVPLALNFDPAYLFGNAAAAATATQSGTPTIIKLGSIAATGNTAPATNYAGTNSRATAPQLPRIAAFPTTAANARSIMINDAGPFLTGVDCALLNTATPAVSIYGAGVTKCKIYKLNLETAKTLDVEVRWATGVTARVTPFVLTEIGANTATAIPTAPTGTGNGVNSTAVQSAAIGVTNVYLVLAFVTGTEPTWTSVRLTQR